MGELGKVELLTPQGLGEGERERERELFAHHPVARSSSHRGTSALT